MIDQARREETQALVQAAEGRRATMEEDVGMQVCPDCGSKHKTPRGLKHHRTHVHGPHKPASPKPKQPERPDGPRVVVVRDGRLTLSGREIAAAAPVFELGGHHFRLVLVVPPEAECECELLA